MLIKHIQEKAADFDKTISYQFYKLGRKLPIRKNYLQILEYSCHGIPWLGIVSIVAFTTTQNNHLIDLLIGLLFDIVYIALAKAFCRRRRPSYAPQDEKAWISVDKLSFPSGHASRSIYVALLASQHTSLDIIVWIWAIMVIVSRVLYGRHFIGDVLAGSFVGYFNYVTQYTLFYPLHSFFKWFLLSVVYETINDNY